MHKYLKNTILFSTFIVLSSCAIKPLKSEYKLIDKNLNKIELNDLGNGKVLIYNAVDVLRQLGDKASLNIWINEKPLGHLKEREYLIVNLSKGTYEFKVLHVNKLNIKNFYEIEVDEATKIIRIEPTSIAHRINIIEEFPADFEKFKYMTTQ